MEPVRNAHNTFAQKDTAYAGAFCADAANHFDLQHRVSHGRGRTRISRLGGELWTPADLLFWTNAADRGKQPQYLLCFSSLQFRGRPSPMDDGVASTRDRI